MKQARKQLGECGLARAVLANERRDFARSNHQINVLKRRL
jgi:hypothetical protein